MKQKPSIFVSLLLLVGLNILGLSCTSLFSFVSLSFTVILFDLLRGVFEIFCKRNVYSTITGFICTKSIRNK